MGAEDPWVWVGSHPYQARSQQHHMCQARLGPRWGRGSSCKSIWQASRRRMQSTRDRAANVPLLYRVSSRNPFLALRAPWYPRDPPSKPGGKLGRVRASLRGPRGFHQSRNCCWGLQEDWLPLTCDPRVSKGGFNMADACQPCAGAWTTFGGG